MSDSYKPVSKYYDLLSSCYSFGLIPRCRNAYLKEILESLRNKDLGELNVKIKVCFAGAGHGDDAIRLAQQGDHVNVTVVDLSKSMLNEFQRKLETVPSEVKSRVTMIHDDIRNVSDHYDWVIANFFLNVFPELEMLAMLDSLSEKCSPCGNLIIGDFYCDNDGKSFVKCLQKMNWYVALAVFRIFVKNAKHPIYDYQKHMAIRGWQTNHTKKFGMLGVSFYSSSQFSRLTNLPPTPDTEYPERRDEEQA